MLTTNDSTQKLPDTVFAELASIFGDRLATSAALRQQHANTTTWIAPEAPDAVVFPYNTSEVQDLARICSRHRIPMIPFGAGSSFEGSVNAPQGGISIDFMHMNKVLAINNQDFDCVVEPGITRNQLNTQLRHEGLFFPVDPGADASLGGMASTRASGTTAVRYGTMKDNVLALKCVLPNGEIVNTGRRARKSSAGYDLTRLIVGAEGTLGIITELTLRLRPIPEAIAAGICSFPSISSACNAAITAMQAGVEFARVEFLDEVMVRACNAHSKLSLTEKPMLFVEFTGTDESVREQSQRFAEITTEFEAESFEWATLAEERSRLWQARHNVFWAAKSYRPGADIVVSDVCVPISRIADCVTETKKDLEQEGLIAPIVGHVGDGNFHACILVNMGDPQELQKAKRILDRVAERAIAMDGTCTGEHGIGQGKQRFLASELGQSAVSAMRTIKSGIDPEGIMNPGKIF
jgi:D-lactate dehydrogenase (cytochrome)